MWFSSSSPSVGPCSVSRTTRSRPTWPASSTSAGPGILSTTPVRYAPERSRSASGTSRPVPIGASWSVTGSSFRSVRVCGGRRRACAPSRRCRGRRHTACRATGRRPVARPTAVPRRAGRGRSPGARRTPGGNVQGRDAALGDEETRRTAAEGVERGGDDAGDRMGDPPGVGQARRRRVRVRRGTAGRQEAVAARERVPEVGCATGRLPAARSPPASTSRTSSSTYASRWRARAAAICRLVSSVCEPATTSPGPGEAVAGNRSAKVRGGRVGRPARTRTNDGPVRYSNLVPARSASRRARQSTSRSAGSAALATTIRPSTARSRSATRATPPTRRSARDTTTISERSRPVRAAAHSGRVASE